jgi:hypothetical protein
MSQDFYDEHAFFDAWRRGVGQCQWTPPALLPIPTSAGRRGPERYDVSN